MSVYVLLSCLKVVRKQQNTPLLHKHRRCILVAVVRDYHCHCKGYDVSELHQKLFRHRPTS